MIETQYECALGKGRLLLYNQRSVRFWSQQRDGNGFTINRVVYDVDINLSRMDDGTWAMGYYENDSDEGHKHGQRYWRRTYIDIVRSDWTKTGQRTATDAAREKVESILPGLIQFIVDAKDLLLEAELSAAKDCVARCEGEVQAKREELAKVEANLAEAMQRLAALPVKVVA